MDQGARVLQVNVSRGGVPKLPVGQAWVSRLGVEGDGHSEPTVHGGPHRAVCLFAVEAIERLQAEGHPVEPGSTGENLTTLGVEWSKLPVGTRARIGERVMLELANSTTPCATQKRNFRDGRFSRISIDLHPTDSRMYARVLEEGPVRPGDPIELLPPTPDSRAADELLLHRLDGAGARSALATWQAAAASGHDVRIVIDGDLAMAASPELPGPEFNQALGLVGLPHFTDKAERFFEGHGTIGWVVVDPDWPDVGAVGVVGAVGTGRGGGDDREAQRLAVYAARPAEVPHVAPPAGVRIRPMRADDLAAWTAVLERAQPDEGWDPRSARRGEIAAHEIESPHLVRLLAENADGMPVAAATLYDHRHSGWLSGAYVAPEARGRGIQRALISARARLAVERGCDLVGAWAEPDGVSAANLAAAGFMPIGLREQRRHVPPTFEMAAR